MNVLVILGYLWWVSRDELFFDPEDRIYTYQESEFEGVSSRLTGKRRLFQHVSTQGFEGKSLSEPMLKSALVEENTVEKWRPGKTFD